MGFCFVHAADLHLDTPFQEIGGLAPEVGRALRDASLDAFDALVDLSVECGAAFLLIAGDVYDGAERGLRAQLRFRSGLERLARSGVQVFVVHGNHDPTEEGWSAIREWPKGTTVFGSERVEAVPVIRAGERIATVHGISYARRDVNENLSLAFPRGRSGSHLGGQTGTGLRVGLLHCNAGGNSEHAPYAACSVDDLAAADIDYWALGHVHTRRTLAGGTSGEPWVVYPGNLQGRSPRACEQGPKGAVVVSVEDGPQGARVSRVDFRELDRVRFLPVSVDVSGLPDLAAVERSLRSAADELRRDHAGRGLVLCVQLVGRSQLQRDLSRAGCRTELLESLRDGCRDHEPFVWWGTISCEVSRPIDRDGLRERDDFFAELVGLVDSLGEQPEELSRFAREAFAELPEELRGVPLPDASVEELALLLARAEQSALERVGGDEG